MRFELAGSLSRPSPLTIIFSSNQSLDISQYIALGYTDFDVIAIGGGGGMGGGIDTANTGTFIRSYGGAGGGGGVHRVQGLLSGLPAVVPVVVGAGGSLGTEDVVNPGLTTDGGDGGASSFNGSVCQASGGKGGRRVQSNSPTVATLADGGQGGVGNSSVAGGGAAGGTAGTPSATGPGTPGTDAANGTWDGSIGKGGGGGAGGVGKYGSGGTMLNAATNGGFGSFDPANPSVYSPSGAPVTDPESGSLSVMPGFGGGGKTTPLTGLPNIYGSSKSIRATSDPGVVAIQLTAK